MVKLSGDLVFTNAEGVVLKDTKRIRIERKRKLAALIVKHRSTDSALARMLNGMEAALRAPAVELVHLGEVFEAFDWLVKNVDAPPLKAMRQECNRLKSLCNHSRIRQGRHVGLTPYAELRDATQEELGEARTLTQQLLDTYLDWLDSVEGNKNTATGPSVADDGDNPRPVVHGVRQLLWC